MARRKKRQGKSLALEKHSFRRAIERYDLYLTEAVREEIIGKIQGNKTQHVETQSHRLSVHDVVLESGEEVRVVYDKRRQQLVTFLYKHPSEYLSTPRGATAERGSDPGESKADEEWVLPAGWKLGKKKAEEVRRGWEEWLEARACRQA